MIALTVKALRALRRETSASPQPGDPSTTRDSSALHLLECPVRWTAIPQRYDRFAAVVAGQAYELHDDSSEQGPRFVISRDGEYLAELDTLPARWTLGGE